MPAPNSLVYSLFHPLFFLYREKISRKWRMNTRPCSQQKKPSDGLPIYLPAILLLIFSKHFVNKHIHNAHAFANPERESHNPDDRQSSRNTVILIQVKNSRNSTGNNNQNQSRKCRDRFHKF
jgi:hypothetical protein